MSLEEEESAQQAAAADAAAAAAVAATAAAEAARRAAAEEAFRFEAAKAEVRLESWLQHTPNASSLRTYHLRPHTLKAACTSAKAEVRLESWLYSIR